jgi:glycine cleavage system H protein
MIDPKTLRYTPTHEWVQVDGETATIGISKFAVDQLTDLILIDLSRSTPGTQLQPGKAFGEVESVKAVADLYAPVQGEVLEVNPAVTSDVQVLAEDPYNKGWLLKVRLADPSQVGKLMDLAAYEKMVAADPHS